MKPASTNTRRTRTIRGRLVPTHGVAEVRRDLERVLNDPAPPRLDFAWMSVPKQSSIGDLVPGSDISIRLSDGRVLVGRYVDETSAQSILFRPWGRPEIVLPKAEIAGARPLGAHSWAARNAVTRRQAAR